MSNRVSFVDQADAAKRHRSAGVSARYDAAQDTDENARSWALADQLSATAAGSPGVRRKLRSRCRYEVDSNSDLNGATLTLGNYCVGEGPTLQMLTKNAALNQAIEQGFAQWARLVRFADKIRALRMARVGTGESFLLATQNPRLNHPVQFSPYLLEADYVATPWARLQTAMNDPERYNDGVTLDEYGNPISYDVLNRHPGSLSWVSGIDFRTVDAAFVHHDFRIDRPGQTRGIPEATPMLPLLNELRRYELACLAAAETAADFAMALEADATLAGENPSVGDPWEKLPLERRMMTTLPPGYKLTQTKAEQPTTTFKEFRREILGKAMRCLNIPITLATLDSGISNMSASYLVDFQTFGRAIRVDRTQLTYGCDWTLDRWLTQALRIPGYLDASGVDEFPHVWFWPQTYEHADPDKVASAAETKLRNNLMTLADWYADKGEDWQAKIAQASKEKQELLRLGLTMQDVTPGNNTRPGSPATARSPFSIQRIGA